jgi:hypothetical protein
LVPHDCPLGALPPGTQTGEPVEHAMVACSHDPPSAQDWPTAHAMHWPLLQTPPSPHTVPA